MNFKEWLLISEEEKIAKAPNPSLTTTIPQLNKISSGKFFNTDISKPNAWTNTNEKGRENSIERLKEIAYYYGRNGKGLSGADKDIKIRRLSKWLKDKKNGNVSTYESDKVTWDNLVKLSNENWIDPVTKRPFPYKDLPKDWRDVKPNVIQEKGRKKSSERLEKIAHYYGTNGTSPYSKHHEKEIRSLAFWLQNKKSGAIDAYESDEETWADMVKLSKTWNKKKFPHDLPNDWRDVEPNESSFSFPAKELRKILNKYFDVVDGEYQDKFCLSKTGRCYRFDFHFEYNNKEYFVEYHGEQHYYPTYFGSTEGMTKKQIAKHALDKFKYTKESDREKYNYCKNENFPLLVIPYWKSSDKFEKIVLSFIRHYNEFEQASADPNPDMPQKNKEYHDRMLNMTKCFASGKLNCKELFKKTKNNI